MVETPSPGQKNYYRSLKNYLEPIRSLILEFTDNNSDSQGEQIIALKTAQSFLTGQNMLKWKNRLEEIICSILNGEVDLKNKLSAIEQSALRKTSELSVNQMISVYKTLNHYLGKVRENEDDNRMDLNPFINYKKWHPVEVESLPSNVTFELYDKKDGTCVLTHKREVRDGLLKKKCKTSDNVRTPPPPLLWTTWGLFFRRDGNKAAPFVDQHHDHICLLSTMNDKNQ